ncbi:MAG: mechanosensitive ion channel family protein [Candidatus Gracilibacteria bacterium]|nr:mechanosensitive ion channel family protein [Candidatus Gracilibacteria bacterium]
MTEEIKEMTEEIKKENKILKFLLIIKNYIFLLLGIIYFWYYFSPKYIELFDYIKSNIPYGEIILEYSNAIMAFFLILGLIGILNRISNIIFNKVAEKTNNDIDNVFVDYLNRFVKTNKYFIGFYVFFSFLTIPDNYQLYINKFFYITFLIIFIYYITTFINVTFESVLIKRTKFKSLNKSLLSFIKKIIIVATWIIGIITILSNLGYNVTALITGAGIGGLAVALAAQKTLSNVFGAITVLLTKPFKIGDYVRIDGQVGTIKEMGISHLTMVDKEGYFVLIPNEKLISNNIENLTKRETRRTEFSIGIEYSTTLLKIKKAVEIIENILEKHVTLEEIASYRVNFDSFGDFSLNIRGTYFSIINDDYYSYIKQKEVINLEIKSEFEKAKISMAFPTQEIIIIKK